MPGEIALLRVGAAGREDTGPQHVAAQQDAAIAEGVVKGQRPRHLQDQPVLPVRTDRVQPPHDADVRRRKPDFPSRRGPCETLHPGPLLGECLLASIRAKDGDGPSVITHDRIMVEEGDRVSGRRNARVADPALRGVADAPHRKFELVPAADPPHYRQPAAARGPVRAGDFLEHFPRGTAR